MPDSSPALRRQNAAHAIAEYLRPFVRSEDGNVRSGYSHMGATLTDAILQAGLNYRTVVLPRVRRLLFLYPFADTTTAFWGLLSSVSPRELLLWSHHEKIGRLLRLTELLRGKGLETEGQLATWLCSVDAPQELLGIRGIGPKTVDYLKILVGVPTVAVDRHAKTLLRLVGPEFTDYNEIKSVLCRVAEILSLPPQELDRIIWQHFSTRPRSVWPQADA
jgi:hypothetical protein